MYNQYIHGELSRRKFPSDIKRFAVAGLSSAAIVEALMPDYAPGQQTRRDDERITTSYETILSPNRHEYIRGYPVRPYCVCLLCVLTVQIHAVKLLRHCQA